MYCLLSCCDLNKKNDPIKDKPCGGVLGALPHSTPTLQSLLSQTAGCKSHKIFECLKDRLNRHGTPANTQHLALPE